MPSGTVEALWVEKYRPRELADLALHQEQRNFLQSCIEQQEIPHLLLSGPPGTGKTTVAKLLVSKLPCQVLMLNASNERGIDTIREKVGGFARSKGLSPWNIVFFDEADRLTAEAQDALRNMMEAYSSVSRFILTCNHPHRITDAVQSRCQPIKMVEMPMPERFRVLQSILLKEAVTAEPAAIVSYAQKFTDLRKMISAAQRSILSHKKLVPAESLQVGGGDLLHLVKNRDWDGLKAQTAQSSFDPQQALREMFWSVPNTLPLAAEFRLRIGKSVREIQFAPDPVIDFLALCAELIVLQQGS